MVAVSHHYTQLEVAKTFRAHKDQNPPNTPPVPRVAQGPRPTQVEKQSLNIETDGLDLSEIDGVLDGMDLDRSVSRLSHLLRGGTTEGKWTFEDFFTKTGSKAMSSIATSRSPTTSRA